MGYIIKTVNVINVPGSSKVPADVAELADAHGSGPCAARLKGSTPFVGTIFTEVVQEDFETIMRVWHIGCAPAFQAG